MLWMLRVAIGKVPKQQRKVCELTFQTIFFNQFWMERGKQMDRQTRTVRDVHLYRHSAFSQGIKGMEDVQVAHIPNGEVKVLGNKSLFWTQYCLLYLWHQGLFLPCSHPTLKWKKTSEFSHAAILSTEACFCTAFHTGDNHHLHYFINHSLKHQ